MPIHERIAVANRLLILHPRFREAVNVLKRCHDSKSHSNEPVCGAILGASGSGKTSVVNHYIRQHPREETETATRQPVLKVTLQPEARPKGIAADILLALEDPAWSSGTVQTLTNRAVKLLQRCGVELIVLDEFHHLFDMERLKVMTKASQWIKVLIVNTGIPVVVCGMPESEHVLRAEHTERRFKERQTLHCFSWRTISGRHEFCGMLKKLDDSLPLAQASGLAEQELAGRFYLACRGVPDYLMTLVRGALTEALQRDSERIEMSDLARVFEMQLSQQRVLMEQQNPFVGALDNTLLEKVHPADAYHSNSTGLTPRAAHKRRHRRTVSDYLGGR
jgi:type II secretory pathway predicted ATPase ExeA